MSKITKNLLAFLKWIPKIHQDIRYLPEENQKLYPYKFRSKEEERAHKRNLDLYLITNMYQ